MPNDRGTEAKLSYFRDRNPKELTGNRILLFSADGRANSDDAYNALAVPVLRSVLVPSMVQSNFENDKEE